MTEQIPLPPSDLSPLIGPHEGRELELMLAGKKKLALFTDLVSVIEAKPEWLPIDDFAPHVEAGRIIKHVHDWESPRIKGTVRTLGYTLPGEEWRFAAAMFVRRDVPKRLRFYLESRADDVIIGRLLGYSPNEIRAFIERSKRRIEQGITSITFQEPACDDDGDCEAGQ